MVLSIPSLALTKVFRSLCLVILVLSVARAALDITLYEAKFAGMKLSGVILIGVGFFLVMLPNNWPDYITRLLRYLLTV